MTTTAQPVRPATGTGRSTRAGRLVLLLAAGVSMLAGLNAALLLLGLPAPVTSAGLPVLHGMLMVLGFLGALISLERAVALRSAWGFLAPTLLGGGALALLSPAPAVLGQLLLVNGAAVLCAVYLQLWRRSWDNTVLVQLLGALLALFAAAFWIRVEIVDLVALLSGFIVLTIAAERVELARISLPRWAEPIVLTLAGALVLAALATMVFSRAGAAAFGLTLLLLAAYLGWHDVARRMVRAKGLPRFAAVAMLAGYAWLAVAGLVWMIGAPAGVPHWYDLVVHGIFLGFGMSMVLAHAPVILPAVLRISLPYHPVLWAPLTVLHAGMVVRMLGMVTEVNRVWQVGGLLTIAALLLLALSAVGVAVWAGRSRSTPAARA
ncbi:hypothetical protein [Pseudactinotalea sp. Z1748]|uniref:hypothetical protein n=1 Tax=Pseudactinotalea sp. Z1748 TaxID=3413027 RepID=UPI003C7C579B